MALVSVNRASYKLNIAKEVSVKADKKFKESMKDSMLLSKGPITSVPKNKRDGCKLPLAHEQSKIADGPSYRGIPTRRLSAEELDNMGIVIRHKSPSPRYGTSNILLFPERLPTVIDVDTEEV